MDKLSQEEGRYRVLLIGIGDNTEEEKDSFCHHLSKNFRIPLPLLKKIVHRCPIVLKKNLTLQKAEALTKTLKSSGASVSVEERRNLPVLSLEFQDLVPHRLALESSYLRKMQRGTWGIIGRVKNISEDPLNDAWALLQLFDSLNELVNFEETPLPINPLPPKETSPFKILFEGDFSFRNSSIAFKTSSGQPIPTVDKRKKREWVEVGIEEGSSVFFSYPLEEVEKESQAIDLLKPKEKRAMEGVAEISNTTPLSLEKEVSPFFGEMIREEAGGEGEKISEAFLSLTPEPSGKVLEVFSNFLEEVGSSGGKGSDSPFEPVTFQEFTSPPSKEMEEVTEGEKALGDSEVREDDEEGAKEPRGNDFGFKETIPSMEDISEETGEVERDEKMGEAREEGIEEENGEGPKLPDYLWIESFRETVEIYYQKPRDIFSIWFEGYRREGEFRNSLHALMTLLVHSRFDQGNQSSQALENTQRSFRLIPQPMLLLKEIPSLEGTSFISGDVWRDLFHRAIPKLQQIAKAILEKQRWKAFELERLIQVIPHMGPPNSRRAMHWINELIPEAVEIDFSDTPITIEEGLYRVTSRLGIVDPHFDYYRGRNSMGDIKIHSFAKMAFPQNPLKIEEPLAAMGGKKERGGHCFPVQPQCEGCLFETFCPRFYLHFNPSVKGMRE